MSYSKNRVWVLNLIFSTFFSFSIAAPAFAFNCNELHETTLTVAMYRAGVKIKTDSVAYKKAHQVLSRIFKNGATFKTKEQSERYLTKMNKCFRTPFNFSKMDQSIVSSINDFPEIKSKYSELNALAAVGCAAVGKVAFNGGVEIAKDFPTLQIFKNDLLLYYQEFGFLSRSQIPHITGPVITYASAGLTGAGTELAMPAIAAFTSGLSIGVGIGILDEKLGNPVGQIMQPIANAIEGVPSKSEVIDRESNLAATRYFLEIAKNQKNK